MLYHTVVVVHMYIHIDVATLWVRVDICPVSFLLSFFFLFFLSRILVIARKLYIRGRNLAS